MATKQEKIPRPETEVENEEIETAPFQEQENEIVESIAEIYVDKTKIDKETIKAVDGFLVEDTEKVYQKFALQWFGNNEKTIKEEGRVIPPGASDEWKISMVLSSREKGGMGAAAEINNPEYESIREEMKKLGVLRTDIKKDQIPPETPFLVLNYLQKSIERKEEDIKDLRVGGRKSEKDAEYTANSIEKDKEELYSVMKGLAAKIMNENLQKMAEQKVAESGFKSKEKYIADGLEAKKTEIEAQKNDKLLEREWQEFSRLPEKQRKKYQKKLRCKLEVQRVPGQTEEDFQKASRAVFCEGISELAEKNGINGHNFYGLLEQGCKPHEAETKGFWNKKVVMPKRNSVGKEMSIKEYNDFVGKSADSYTKGIESQAKKELEDKWDKDFDERVDAEIESRVKELAKSPEAAEGGIEEVYQRAKERIVAEYVKKRVEKIPKTKEQLATIEKKFKEKGEKRDINDFMSAVLSKKGRLENLSDNINDGRKNIRGFLGEWGIEATPDIIKNILPEEYKRAKKTQMGLFGLIMKVVEKAFELKTSKRNRKLKTK